MKIFWRTYLSIVLMMAVQANIAQAQHAMQAKVRRPIAIEWAHGRLWVANQRSGTISAVDLDQRIVVSEIDVGQSLVDLQLSVNGRRMWTIDHHAAELIAFEWDEDQNLKESMRQSVPLTPISLSLSTDGKCLSVACLWPRKIVLLALDATGSPQHVSELTLPFCPREQRFLSPDRLLIADAFAGRLAVIDVGSLAIVAQHDTGGQNIRGLALTADGDQVRMTLQRISSSHPTTHEGIFWGSVLQNVLVEVPTEALQSSDVNSSERHVANWYELAQYLGFPSQGAGDPDSISCTDDGRTLIALAGVNQLAIRPGPQEVFKHLAIGLRPVDIALDQEGHRAAVACQMDDSLAIVDLRSLTVAAQIHLGPKAEPSLSERGEVLFYDANLSLDGWYSCHSCHPDGHTTGFLNDNFGDDSTGAPKRIHSLLGTGDTEPWAWSGNATSLDQQVKKSLEQTMHSTGATEEAIQAIAEFVRTLAPPPSGKRCFTLDVAAIKRGAEVFQKHDCTRCHAGTTFTTTGTFDVGIHDELGVKEFNPPSLRGVVHRDAFFHDNRATSLEEVFSRYGHPNETRFSETEISDLIEYLRSL